MMNGLKYFKMQVEKIIMNGDDLTKEEKIELVEQVYGDVLTFEKWRVEKLINESK